MDVNVESLGPVGHEIASRARHGETIVLKENGQQPVTLTPAKQTGGLRGRGIDKGRFHVPDDFKDTSEEIIRDFEG